MIVEPIAVFFRWLNERCDVYNNNILRVFRSQRGIPMAIDPSKRTKSIKVYVFEEEKAAIEEKAAATSTTASEYLRSCGLKRALTVKPTPDLISIKVYAGRVKSELMMLLHLVKETNNQLLLETVNSALVHVDKMIAAAFQMNAGEDEPDEGVED